MSGSFVANVDELRAKTLGHVGNHSGPPAGFAPRQGFRACALNYPASQHQLAVRHPKPTGGGGGNAVFSQRFDPILANNIRVLRTPHRHCEDFFKVGVDTSRAFLFIGSLSGHGSASPPTTGIALLETSVLCRDYPEGALLSRKLTQ